MQTPSPVEIKEIIKDFDLGETIKIESLLTSGNLTYLIISDKGKLVLRLSSSNNPDSPRYRSSEEIEAELELIDYLSINDFPAPIPLIKKDGSRVVNWQNRFGFLRQYDNGEAKPNPTLSEIRKFGQVFGRFHQLTKNYQTKNSRPRKWDLKNLKKYFPENKKLILSSQFPNKEKFIEKVEDILNKLNSPLELPTGMIHEDLGKRHVLWKNGTIVCLLDFDRSYFGKLVLDLGQTLRGWCFVNDWKNWNQENFEVLIESYQEKRPLGKIEKVSLIDAIKFGVLERALSFCLNSINRNSGELINPEKAELAQRSVFSLIEIIDYQTAQINNFTK